MRTEAVRPEVESAARHLKWIAAFHVVFWGIAAAVCVGALLLGGATRLNEGLEPGGVNWLFSPAPFLYVFALVPSALLVSFAQQLRRALGTSSTSDPSGMAVGAVFAPFILPAVVFVRLDDQLASLRPPPSLTRGALLAAAPLSLFVVGPIASALVGDRTFTTTIALFALTRVAWSAMTIRSCRSILARAAIGSMRAHGDSPVAGG